MEVERKKSWGSRRYLAHALIVICKGTRVKQKISKAKLQIVLHLDFFHRMNKKYVLALYALEC
ncbi:MAG: hypothetical protein A2077_02025 [Nitrospirae bacterium GWC2_46_6]|nr:MAG: hypothetical protein A2077_02025 [Nitrospirae bacterium GWC2_46_6]OGW21874.1 MAG: hypothetical protein A2Z82_09700 [Nitrospirae bacterium GWA2_46_11]OGW25149.1 MAG: hypothetical protein A2X55_11735 [Nitrospirae bacterium GWB2_47_37]HAK89571.1 hypothetical protein [Nitrospiraceae bacterium]HCL81587.1 hypothetical protein [Nitrospiraceae bacterium]